MDENIKLEMLKAKMTYKIRKNLTIILLSLFLITFYSSNYPQENISRSNKIKYEFKEETDYSGTYDLNSNSRKITPETAESRYTRNYFKIDNSGNSLWNGKHWIPDKFPLKVYVHESKSSKYKKVFKEFIDYAFKVWQRADSRIKYSYISSSDNADIVILFEENLMDKYDENFLGLTDYELEANREIKLSRVEISLLKYKNELLSEGEIKATIIHEIGHALGLGHSSNSADLMYPYIDPESTSEMNYNELSRGDMEAIKSVIDLCYYMKYSWN